MARRQRHPVTYSNGAWPISRQKKWRAGLYDVDLMRGLVDILPKDSSIVDIGASAGSYLKGLKDHGYAGELTGLDGTPGIDELTDGLVNYCDLTDEASCKPFQHCADWGLFIEVGEHVPELLEGCLLDNVCQIPRREMIVTWAAPGQRGRGHVNCHTDVYVAQQFCKRDWMVSEADTIRIRKQVGRRWQHRIMVLTRW